MPTANCTPCGRSHHYAPTVFGPPGFPVRAPAGWCLHDKFFTSDTTIGKSVDPRRQGGRSGWLVSGPCDVTVHYTFHNGIEEDTWMAGSRCMIPAVQPNRESGLWASSGRTVRYPPMRQTQASDMAKNRSTRGDKEVEAGGWFLLSRSIVAGNREGVLFL